MAKMEFLKKVQHYKNAIDVYSGSDPLKPRYEYIMWLENSVGKENSDVNTCLEQTLQMFQKDPRYVNDTRFVELLILFTRLKGDKLSYFDKLYNCQLGAKCAIFYKAWSDELVIHKKFKEAYNILKTGLHGGAEPKEILWNAEREIECYLGKQILLGRPCCDILRTPCSCVKIHEVVEEGAVKNWELNPLKPGEIDDFKCPLVIHDPHDPNKIPMYPKHLVYCEDGEFQIEEIRAYQYFQKLCAENAKPIGLETPARTEDPPTPSSKEHQQPIGDLSCGTQSFTANTKVALNLVQGMWESPNPPGRFSQSKDNFKVPEAPKTVGATPFAVFNDSVLQEPENAGISRGGTVQKSCQKGGLSERKLMSELRMSEAENSGQRNAKHQLMFGCGSQDAARDAPHRVRTEEDELAMLLDPANGSPPPVNKLQVDNDWNLDDLTCTTKVFNNCLTYSSTPNMKGKENTNTPQAENLVRTGNSHKSDTVVLSTILEASKETPSSGSSNNENRPSNILEVEKSMDRLDINTTDPFCPKLQEKLLIKVNYPHNLDPALIQNYHILNARFPNITKTLKLGDQVYSLTGESFKGAYAKVLKVTCNDQTQALKIEKPPCHWEYYICKEIRSRLNSDQVKYFADITSAYFYPNGSILTLSWAKYGTLLNVINQNKLSAKLMDTPVKLFFCIEVFNAVHYLNSICKIIHADVKPDNFIVHSLPNLSSGPYVQLIDFGRSIDMELMPHGCKFTNVVTTDGFQCNEMKENRPWTYQTDLYGLAGTMYCILVGDYMKVTKKEDTYVLSRPLARLYQSFWNPIFKELLNIESCDALPDLGKIKKVLDDSYIKYDTFSIKNAFNSLANALHGN